MPWWDSLSLSFLVLFLLELVPVLESSSTSHWVSSRNFHTVVACAQSRENWNTERSREACRKKEKEKNKARLWGFLMFSSSPTILQDTSKSSWVKGKNITFSLLIISLPFLPSTTSEVTYCVKSKSENISSEQKRTKGKVKCTESIWHSW